MDDRTRREIQEVVDLVVRARMEQLRELQIQDFADCMTIFLTNFAQIIEAQTDGRIKEILANKAAEAKETSLRHRPGFT